MAGSATHAPEQRDDDRGARVAGLGDGHSAAAVGLEEEPGDRRERAQPGEGERGARHAAGRGGEADVAARHGRESAAPRGPKARRTRSPPRCMAL